MQVSLSDCRSNRFLAALAPVDIARWLHHFDSMEVSPGMVLVEAHARQRHVFFPLTAVLALDRTSSAGPSAEIAVIGREGFAGMPVVLGGTSALDRTAVRLPGRLLRLPARCVEAEMEKGTAVMRHLLHFTSALLLQMAHMEACAAQA